MIYNVSYNTPATTKTINEAVGKPFLLKERLKMRGIGSPRLTITSCSKEIYNLMALDNNANYCNIEIRPKGIIVGFRSLLESYALVIPYYKLTIFKGEAKVYSIYKDQYFVKVKVADNSTKKFLKKLLAYKANQEEEQALDQI